MCRAILEEVQPDVLLYLAIRKTTYRAIFLNRLGSWWLTSIG
ncbi:hypothetical protein [Lyngbya sp. PCC 8106]